MDTDRLAAAYAALVGRGERVSVRALRAEAGVSTAAASEYLRGVTSSVQAPTMPDLSDALTVVWAAAWSQAVEAARAEVEADLGAAREAEAAALAEADASSRRETEARAASLRAEDERRHAAAEARRQDAEVERLRVEVEELRREVAAAASRADRAEATAEALTRVLDALRASPGGVSVPGGSIPAREAEPTEAEQTKEQA